MSEFALIVQVLRVARPYLLPADDPDLIELEALRAIIRAVFSLCTPLAAWPARSRRLCAVQVAGIRSGGSDFDLDALSIPRHRWIAGEHVRFTIETEAGPDFVLDGRDNLDIGSLVEIEEPT